MRVLVLGIGNLVMSDDGVGVRVAKLLQHSYRFADGVEVVDGGTLGLDLLPRIGEAEKLVLVDAVETGEPPGTLVRLCGDEIPLALETKLSPHQMGLKDLLAVASLTGDAPEETVLLGVQPERIEMSLELSPAVAARVGPLVESVLRELAGWGFGTVQVNGPA